MRRVLKVVKKALILALKSAIILIEGGPRELRRRLSIQFGKNAPRTIAEAQSVQAFFWYILLPDAGKLRELQSGKRPRLLWFIPDFGKGSGGHLNIFRFIMLLDSLGFDSDVAIIERTQWGDEDSLRKRVAEFFFPLRSRFFVVRTAQDFPSEKYAGAVATSWQTAYFVRAFGACLEKFYFVQDFEPFFFPPGSMAAFAEKTYTFGFTGITAGSWLSSKLTQEFGMKCSHFSFSVERELYKPKLKLDTTKRVFFYARPPTERRGFELGMISLSILAKRVPSLEVHFAGWDQLTCDLPCQAVNHGIMNVSELGELYSQCDAALVLSFTNLSLLPLELLACGCPVIINDGDNNRWIDQNGEALKFVNPDPHEIALALENLIMNKPEAASFIKAGQGIIEGLTWDEEAKRVAAAFRAALLDVKSGVNDAT